ncbi:hypothetical protein CsatA_023864 [Cannabis sativa]
MERFLETLGNIGALSLDEEVTTMGTLMGLEGMGQALRASPQTKLLKEACSPYNATDFADFFSNLNTTLSDLGAQIREGDKWFATAQQARGSDPVYAMAQCRNYLSSADCAACFAAAEKQIRNCSAANGARIIYDGCFLRYEANEFFDQATVQGNVAIFCGKQTIPPSAEAAAAFTSTVDDVLLALQAATPKINGYFAAEKRQVPVSVAGDQNLTVYGVAQCAHTVSRSGCLDCLKVAYANLQHCLPDLDGKAIDAGCFLRYSNASFFDDNQTTNLAPYLNGNIIGSTELQGPVNFKYNDLRHATKNFSEQNKLGEGGFGDVYKGSLKNGKIVAVKKLAIGKTERGKADFESEVRLISNVHHRNLVRLLGCCNSGPQLLLVYEYMPNSSLDRFLFEKADTYSYGVVVLEIISGQKSTEIKAENDSDSQYLLQRAWNLYENKKHIELVDEKLEVDEYEKETVKKIIEIALMCVQSSPALRPTMSEVVVLLKTKNYYSSSSSSIIEESQPLTRPVFVDVSQKSRDNSTSTASSTISNATVSISRISGR